MWGIATGRYSPYSTIKMKGLPNTQYTYIFEALPGAVDGGLVYGTIDSWTRIFESNAQPSGQICNGSSPVGSYCYIPSGFKRTLTIETDEKGYFQWIFIACGYDQHPFYGSFTLIDKNRIVGTTTFYVTH